MSNFGIFYDAPSPNMAMSRDPRSNFREKIFLLILHLILGKFTNFLVEKLSTSEVISQKPHGEWKTPPSAFIVNLVRPAVFKARQSLGVYEQNFYGAWVVTEMQDNSEKCFQWNSGSGR